MDRPLFFWIVCSEHIPTPAGGFFRIPAMLWSEVVMRGVTKRAPAVATDRVYVGGDFNWSAEQSPVLCNAERHIDDDQFWINPTMCTWLRLFFTMTVKLYTDGGRCDFIVRSFPDSTLKVVENTSLVWVVCGSSCTPVSMAEFQPGSFVDSWCVIHEVCVLTKQARSWFGVGCPEGNLVLPASVTGRLYVVSRLMVCDYPIFEVFEWFKVRLPSTHKAQTLWQNRNRQRCHGNLLKTVDERSISCRDVSSKQKRVYKVNKGVEIQSGLNKSNSIDRFIFCRLLGQEFRSLHDQYPNWIICIVPHKSPQSGFESWRKARLVPYSRRALKVKTTLACGLNFYMLPGQDSNLRPID